MIKERLLKDYQVGEHFEPLAKKPITRVQLAKYAGASGDFNPLHLDDDFAQKIGMKGVIAHGMLIMGFLGEYVMQLAGQDAKITQFKMRFGKMTFLGDQIQCNATVKERYEENEKQFIVLEVTATKNEEEVVGSGIATLQLA